MKILSPREITLAKRSERELGKKLKQYSFFDWSLFRPTLKVLHVILISR
jgi:hypothetical protein